MVFRNSIGFRVVIIIFISFYSNILHAQTISFARSIIDTLTSPYFYGRGYCCKGDSLAARYISSQFEKLKLIPFGNNYFQSFSISINTFPGNMLVVVDSLILKPGIDYLISPSASSLSGKFPVKHCSVTELFSWQLLENVIRTAADSCLFIHETDFPLTKNQSDSIKINIHKIEEGLTGISLILIEQKEPLIWGISQVQHQGAVLYIKKDILSENATFCEVEIENHFFEHYITANVTGYIQGTQFADSFIFVTAHYDHLGMMGRDVYFPGANDNASGVAMMLSLANYFAKNPLKYSVLFIAFSAEEPGLLGSVNFVKNASIDLKKIKFLLNFDLAGTGDEGIKVVNSTIYRNEFERMKRINDSLQLVPAILTRGRACNSDHCPFDQAGVPCFYIYTLGGISAYHHTNDKAETLPLTIFDNYYNLIIKFLEGF